MDNWIESSEFTLGINKMKAMCMETRVEGGKQVITEQVTTGKLAPGKLSALLKYSQAMHANVKSLLEVYFTS